MAMLRRLKIRNRLAIGFALVLALSLSTTLISIFEANKIYQDTKNLYERPYLVSNYLRDIKINALNIRRYMLNIAISNDSAEINQLKHNIAIEEKIAVEKFEQVKKIYYGNPNDLEESYQFFLNYRKMREDIFGLKIYGSSNIAITLTATRNREYVDELFKKMQIAIDNTAKGANEFFLNAKNSKDRVFLTLFILAFVSLALSIFMAYVITNSISKPLLDVVNNIKEIARGNLSNPKLNEGEDEIGQLASSYNQMQDDLLNKAIIAEQIANGDFSANVRPKSENDIVARSINMIANNFQQVVEQAEKVAEGDFERAITKISSHNPLVIVITKMLDSLKEVVLKARQIAAGDYTGEILPKSKSDELALALNQMTVSLRKATQENEKQSRLKTAQNELNELMRGDIAIEEIANNVLVYVTKYTNSQVGAFYVLDEEKNCYFLKGKYAFSDNSTIPVYFREGESIIGQAAMEKKNILLKDLPEKYLTINSGIVSSKPKNILAVPLIYNNSTVGVFEIGSLYSFSHESMEFIDLVKENIAISILSAINRFKMANLLEITTAQAEELQVQQEELRETNEELETQAAALKKSEEYLQSQQEELKMINEELEEKTKKLEDHKNKMEKQNHDLEATRLDLEQKAKELETTNRYKSEFLANMSHELRTPLNSLLILAQNLMENKDQNLSEVQIESAEIIYNSGNDLLNLINDILDLSKIESGKMNISYANFPVSKIENTIQSNFGHLLRDKKLAFNFIIDTEMPKSIQTDEQRLNQIIRNLISNAIKFTEKGSITVKMYKPDAQEDLSRSGLNHHQAFAISVKDTGIGISKDKQLEIFEAFQQADGSISRKYGGTGLGLSITRELAKLLGGEIKVNSEYGEGSEFIVFLPIRPIEVVKTKQEPAPVKREALKPAKPVDVVRIPDDRNNFDKDKSCILIIEDDINFAQTLINLCKQKSIQYLFSSTGEEGVELAEQYLPKGIILDINLPAMDGWSVLDFLKNNPNTRHIPVHVISVNEQTIEAFNKGVWGYLTKPVRKESLESAFQELQTYMSRKIKRLLLVEDNDNLRKSTRTLLTGNEIEIDECATAKKAHDLIKTNKYDCVVLDIGLPDESGIELLKRLKEAGVKVPPIVVYTGREISREEHLLLQEYTQNIIIKGAKSAERLLDETSLFLHRVVDQMPDLQKKMLVNLYNKDEMFRDKVVLVVDDDMRNVFALTQVLEANHMKVLIAANGKKAIDTIEENKNIHLILMDIMMPIMDGYETMKHIRNKMKLTTVPIIALTAKAMKEDREKALNAGANDYLSKPVDIHRLFNVMRIWLYQ